MIQHFILFGEPRGKESVRSGKGHTYTAPRTREYLNQLRLAYLSQVRSGQFPTGRPLQMAITAYYRIPKSASKIEQERMEAGLIIPTRKPDVDNLAKNIQDSINGLAYHDDSQITTEFVRKLYSAYPRVEVWITDEGIRKIADW